MPLAPSIFLERIVRFLLPFFLGVTTDRAAAYAEIVETLASYGARTRAELITAAQIIAFGFAALDQVAEVKVNPDLTAAQRTRGQSVATRLNRACQQMEAALTKRLGCDAPGATPHTSQQPDIETPDEAEDALETMTQVALAECFGRRPPADARQADAYQADAREAHAPQPATTYNRLKSTQTAQPDPNAKPSSLFETFVADLASRTAGRATPPD